MSFDLECPSNTRSQTDVRDVSYGIWTFRPQTIRPFIVKKIVFHCLLEAGFRK